MGKNRKKIRVRWEVGGDENLGQARELFVETVEYIMAGFRRRRGVSLINESNVEVQGVSVVVKNVGTGT